MFEEFRNYIKENSLFGGDGKILLAVSGGIDSMTMAHLFLKLGIKTGIAHCNFCLRGVDSEMDEAFVRDFAHLHSLPFFSARFETLKHAAENNISVQMAARELRYEWFENIMAEHGFDYTAVAHNLNDKIETLLINLVRGTGLKGLTGIRPAGNRIVRPLLFATRSRIEEYCRNYNISFREDKTNSETKYTRNKIRHLVIPILREINPSVEESLAETAQKLAEVNEILEVYINNIRESTSVTDENKTVFDIEKLLMLKPGKSLIYEIFSPFGITGPMAGDLLQMLCGTSGKKKTTKTHLIVKNRNQLIISKTETAGKESYLIRTPEELQDVPFIEEVKVMNYISGLQIPDDRNLAFIDFERIRFPLLIRRWETGDFFFPLGMKNRKKLSDYFIDRKIPVTEKEKALILVSEGNIVWLLGERLDDRYKLSESTSKILLIRLLPCRP